MLISTDVLVAMRCPECGKLEYHNLSRFAFSRNRQVKIHCSCGYVKITINAKRKGRYYWLQFPCIVCETKHLIKVPISQIWSRGKTTIRCDATGTELASIGSADKVKGHNKDIRKEIEALVGNFWGDDYFNNAKVMYETLHYLHDIAEQKMLRCWCGNRQISVDVFPDRLELFCNNCDTVNTIFAEEDEDLEIISHVEKIELTQNRLKCIDSLSNYRKLWRGYMGSED